MSNHEFKPKAFIKAATEFLEGKMAAFFKDIKGTPLEEPAITYGIREGWLMANEGIEDITLANLFPNAWPGDWSRKVVEGRCTEKEAKLGLAEASKADLREANAGIERVRHGVDAPRTRQEAIPATLAGGKEQEQGLPPAALKSPAKGQVEGLASSTVRLHRCKVGGVELVTIDKYHLETLQAAQVQKATMNIAWEPSPIGNLITALHITNP